MTEGRIKLGGEIQRRRKLMGLSQEELAQMMNVSRQSVTKWETGQSAPDLDRLIQLSDVLRVSLDNLLKNPDASAALDISDVPEDAEVSDAPSADTRPELLPPHSGVPVSTRPGRLLWRAGLGLFCTGAAGLLILWVLSRIHPVQLTDWDGTRSDGLWGYILARNLQAVFFAALAVFTAGGLLSVAARRLLRKAQSTRLP